MLRLASVSIASLSLVGISLARINFMRCRNLLQSYCIDHRCPRHRRRNDHPGTRRCRRSLRHDAGGVIFRRLFLPVIVIFNRETGLRIGDSILVFTIWSSARPSGCSLSCCPTRTAMVDRDRH